MLIADDTGLVKKGTTSAGVGRHTTRTSGKIGNCQIGVFAAYATGRGRALVDRELYLPKAWTSDRERCRAAKIPDEREFATTGELAKAIVTRCRAAGLPADWVTADEAYGQEWKFRACSRNSASAVWSRCRNHSRSKAWPGSGESTNSSPRLPRRPTSRPSPVISSAEPSKAVYAGPVLWLNMFTPPPSNSANSFEPQGSRSHLASHGDHRSSARAPRRRSRPDAGQ